MCIFCERIIQPPKGSWLSRGWVYATAKVVIYFQMSALHLRGHLLSSDLRAHRLQGQGLPFLIQHKDQKTKGHGKHTLANCVYSHPIQVAAVRG